jgi:hypothetical protein
LFILALQTTCCLSRIAIPEVTERRRVDRVSFFSSCFLAYKPLGAFTSQDLFVNLQESSYQVRPLAALRISL